MCAKFIDGRAFMKAASAMIVAGFAAANRLVARLAELGILREITGHARNRRFRYEPYVRLFIDDPEDEA